MHGPLEIARSNIARSSVSPKSLVSAFSRFFWNSSTLRAAALGLALACGGESRTPLSLQTDGGGSDAVSASNRSDGSTKKKEQKDLSIKPPPLCDIDAFKSGQVNQRGSPFFQLSKGGEMMLVEGYRLEMVGTWEEGEVVDFRLLGPDPENRIPLQIWHMNEDAKVNTETDRLALFSFTTPSGRRIEGGIRLCYIYSIGNGETSNDVAEFALSLSAEIERTLRCQPSGWFGWRRMRYDAYDNFLALPPVAEGYRMAIHLLGAGPTERGTARFRAELERREDNVVVFEQEFELHPTASRFLFVDYPPVRKDLKIVYRNPDTDDIDLTVYQCLLE